jgi:hypothetical protein
MLSPPTVTVTAYCDKYVESKAVPEELSVYALAHLLQTTIIVHHLTLAEPVLAGNKDTATQYQLEHAGRKRPKFCFAYRPKGSTFKTT